MVKMENYAQWYTRRNPSVKNEMIEKLTPQQIEDIRARCELHAHILNYCGENCENTKQLFSLETTEFIANVRADMPALLNALELLQAEIEEQRSTNEYMASIIKETVLALGQVTEKDWQECTSEIIKNLKQL